MILGELQKPLPNRAFRWAHVFFPLLVFSETYHPPNSIPVIAFFSLWRREGVLSCTPTWSPIPPQASSHLPLRLSSPEHSTALASQHCCLPTGIKFSFVREQPEAESRLILVVCLGSLRVKGLALKTWGCPHQGCFGSSTQTSHSYWLE